MKIVVVGASSALGMHVIPRLLERGHTVRAVLQRADGATVLEQMGVEIAFADLFNRRSLVGTARGAQAALHLAMAAPKNGSQDENPNDRVRSEVTRNLLDALLRSEVRRYVQQSTTLVYGEQGSEAVDESAPVQLTAIAESAIRMESLVRSSGLEWTILRGGLFYGPGTGREDSWWQAARAGSLTIPADGRDLISLVHVVDMARAIVAAVEQVGSSQGRIYNIVDDEPAAIGSLFRHIAAQAGAPPPRPGGPRFLPSLGVKNLKAQLELSWRPAYPNYLTGLAYSQYHTGFRGEPIMMRSPHAAESLPTEVLL